MSGSSFPCMGGRPAWVGLFFLSLAACSSVAPHAPAPESPTPTVAAPDDAVVVVRPVGAMPRLVPVEGVVSLAVGNEHACVARADGRVLCWGNGATYRLGQGIAEASKEPVLVPSVDRAVQVAAGGAISCAIKQDATVLCWGGYRQIDGDPDGMEWPMVRLPQVVGQPVAWTRQVTAGWTQASLLDGAGGVSILDAYLGPVPLPAFASAKAIASFSDGFCALTTDGRVQCVSSSEFGTSGNGGGDGGFGEEPALAVAPLSWSESLRPTFVDAEGNQNWAPCNAWSEHEAAPEAAPVDTRPGFCKDPLVGASAIDAAGSFACAVLADGGLACWGCAGCFDDKKPPLGLPDVVATVPFRIPGVANVVSVAVGGRHVCTLHKDGAVRCWGDDDAGQLGPEGRGSTATPTVISGLGEVVRIDAGEANTCALRKNATVVCWGHVLGTALPDRYVEPALDDNVTTPPVTERPLPEGLAGEPPRAELACRDIDVYDKDGDLIEVQYRYDKKGRLAEERRLRWGGSGLAPELTTVYARDAKGQVKRESRQEVRAGGEIYQSSFRYRYDRAGNLIWKKGEARADDSAYTFEWDGKGRLVALRPSWGGAQAFEWRERSGSLGSRFAGLTLNESWSDADNLPGEEPVVLRFAVDAAGRAVYERVSTAAREIVEYWTTFDAAGRELVRREATFVAPFFEDPLTRRESHFTYDAAGRLVMTELFEVGADPVTRSDTLTPVTRTVHLYVGCL